MQNLLETKSSIMQAIIQKIESVARTNTTVLLTGESGTGKNIFAKKIHQLSLRNKNKFVSIHCGALPESLIESELFGHEKGSFTGAINKKLGKFELANGGTVLLDEIGTLSEATQIRLLQVLQERFIQRVGGEENIEIDIRIIAATNSDLKSRIQNKTFREDLYYRLNVFEIELPRLNQRYEDLELLTKSILAKFNQQYQKNIHHIQREVLTAFRQYSWPGNIRELENLIERAYVLEKTCDLTIDHFPPEMLNFAKSPHAAQSLNLNEAPKNILNDFEVNYMQELLKETKGNLKKAALVSGVSIRQLHKFMAKHQIDRKRFLSQPESFH